MGHDLAWTTIAVSSDRTAVRDSQLNKTSAHAGSGTLAPFFLSTIFTPRRNQWDETPTAAQRASPRWRRPREDSATTSPFLFSSLGLLCSAWDLVDAPPLSGSWWGSTRTCPHRSRIGGDSTTHSTASLRCGDHDGGDHHSSAYDGGSVRAWARARALFDDWWYKIYPCGGWGFSRQQLSGSMSARRLLPARQRWLSQRDESRYILQNPNSFDHLLLPSSTPN
jgi:hypothetical protein